MNKVCTEIKILFLKQDVHGQGKSQGKKYFFKVGEFFYWSGNLHFQPKVGERSGNFEKTGLYTHVLQKNGKVCFLMFGLL